MAEEKKKSQALSSLGDSFGRFMSRMFAQDPKPNVDDEKSSSAAALKQRLEAVENQFKERIPHTNKDAFEIFPKFDLVEKEILIGLFKHGILWYRRESFSVFLNQYHQFWHAKKNTFVQRF